MTRRAILSVYDKTGLVDFACGSPAGFELVASGGSAALAAAGLPVVPVEQVTGHPEILGGRAWDLAPGHPRRHLARRIA